MVSALFIQAFTYALTTHIQTQLNDGTFRINYLLISNIYAQTSTTNFFSVDFRIEINYNERNKQTNT